MLENFGVFRREDQMLRQIEIIDGLRERYPNVFVEDKGDVFNNDLTQAIELGYMLDLAAVDAAGRRRAQGEPRRPLAAARLPDPRRRELHEALDHALGRRRPEAVVQAGAQDEVGAHGAQVLMRSGTSSETGAVAMPGQSLIAGAHEDLALRLVAPASGS